MVNETHKKMTRGGLFAVVLASLAGVATVQAGPDVIVGDLPAVTSPMGPGTNASGEQVYAYAIGTTSCNVGDTPLNWWSSVNEHPVIGQNIYRLDMANNRFMQVGQIWLKHGFTALQGTVCGSCSPTAGTTLGVGCSDPYSAGLNAGQSGLGPKSEVTPSTGEYPYPWVNNGSGSGAIHKRLQVRTTDLTAANSQWFCSGQYVCHDDAIAGNGNNNESYRRMTLSGQTFTVVGSTQRGIPAVYAWRDHGLGANVPDPSVNIAVFDVPNDARQLRTVGSGGSAGAPTASGLWATGRAFLASKVIQTSATSWRYEYAVENLTVDRAFQAFQLPMPAGATVLQAGFRDVDHHSGEPYALTDWTVGSGSGTMTWSTQTYATNVNANALRWGTMYNFWVECNASPSTGDVVLPIFKPVPAGAPGGTPTQMSVSTTVPTNVVGSGSPPANDNCANAQTVGNGTYYFDSTNATTDGPDACLAAGQTQITKDVWFRYTTPNCDALNPLTISTCGTNLDTKIAIYDNSCPTAAGSQLACNDDSTTCGSGSLQSYLSFNATPNTTYLIRVGGYNGAGGLGAVSILSDCAPPGPPANDLCANAFWIAAGVATNTNTGATPTQSAATFSDVIPSGVCGSAGTSPDVWFKYRPLTSGSVSASTCGSAGSYDTVLEAYSGACGAMTRLACNDDTCGLLSTVTFNGVAGTTYYIRVTGYNGAVGASTVTVTGGGGVVPPANDDCANRAGIGLGPTPFSTLGASTDGSSNALCNSGGFNQITNDIWYNHPALCTGTLTIDTCDVSTNFNTRLAVYAGSTCGSPIIACNDDGACGSGRSSISIPVVAGSHYLIRIGGTNNAAGNGIVTLSCVPTPPQCDPDVNQDGNVDQDDVTYIINVVGGGANPTGIDPDFNQDGNVDQDDVSSLINTVGGGGCP
ncbi:MAG: hypothetical protein IT433_07955 [Phycisphaerales bacterium]|nr:hypothetical protein [Phycisphaerales bacterium]